MALFYHLLEQDKRQGVVVMDRLKYSEKCFKMLSTRQFKVVENDLPNHFNQKYNVLLENWNLKSQMKNINTFIRQVKATMNGNLNGLPFSSIVSNINTSTYKTAEFYHYYASLIIYKKQQRLYWKYQKGEYTNWLQDNFFWRKAIIH